MREVFEVGRITVGVTYKEDLEIGKEECPIAFCSTYEGFLEGKYSLVKEGGISDPRVL